MSENDQRDWPGRRVILPCLVVLGVPLGGLAFLVLCVLFSDLIPNRDTFRVKTSGYAQLPLPEKVNPEGIGETVFIHGGVFAMGAPDSADDDLTVPGRSWPKIARPLHDERVDSFEIGNYKVTATEFVAFLNDVVNSAGHTSYLYGLNPGYGISYQDGSYVVAPGFENAPAMGVTFQGAEAYCRWLSQVTGDRYRLPSELEWELAARGKEGRTYPWGEESPVGRCYLAIHYSLDKPMPMPSVGQYPDYVSPEGVHDLIGGPEEWCSNYFYNYPTMALKDFLNENEFRRFLRGERIRSMNKFFDGELASLRGGGYYDRQRQATANGWTRHSGGLKTLTTNTRTYKSFRVLKEIGNEPGEIE